MESWIVYTLLATLFAGVSAILVRLSIRGIDAELSMVIRIAIVFVLVLINLFAVKGYKAPIQLSYKTLSFLVISGITTGLCWIFYYKAIDIGNVSMITAIEKGSIVITIMLAVAFLGEPFTLRLAMGAGLILLGMVVLIWK